jgi:hypothetical protein
MSDDLSILNPGTEIVVKGETLKITPFKFGQFAKVAKLVGIIKPLVGKHLSVDQETKQVLIDFPNLIADCGESIFELCIIAIKKPRAYFDDIEGEDGIAIVAAVVEQNKEAFLKKWMPAAGKVVLTPVAEESLKVEMPTEAGAPSTQS